MKPYDVKFQLDRMYTPMTLIGRHINDANSAELELLYLTFADAYEALRKALLDDNTRSARKAVQRKRNRALDAL